MKPLVDRIEEKIVIILFSAAFAETDQLRLALGGLHRDATRRVLRRMTRAGLVQPLPAVRRRRRVWALTPKGGRAGAQFLGQDPPTARAWAQQLELWRHQVHHNLAVADFFLELIRLGDPPQQGLTRWYGPWIASRWFPVSSRPGRSIVCPDAIGTYVFLEVEVDFLLEMDMGTESLDTLGDKSVQYLDALSEREAVERRNVAIITDPPSRVARVRVAIKRRMERAWGGRPNFWIASRTEIASGGLLSPVWLDLEGNATRMSEWPGFPRESWDACEFIGHRAPDGYRRDASGRFC